MWQESSHREQMQSDAMMWGKIEYIHNPMRRGYVEGRLDWRCSSAGNYAGQAGLIDIVTDWRWTKQGGLSPQGSAFPGRAWERGT